jgi:2-keto-3-deoxy-L-rhamnonate aldolase RhmA
MGLIEDPAAVDRIDEIPDGGCLDVVMPGPADLAAGFGVPGELDHPVVAAAVERVLAGTEQRSDVQMAVYISDASAVAGWIERGVRIFVCSIDYKFIARMYVAAATEFKAASRGKASA